MNAKSVYVLFFAISLLGAAAISAAPATAAQPFKYMRIEQRGARLLVVSFKFNQVMGSKEFFDTLGGAARDPWVASVLSRALAARGVPPDWKNVELPVAAAQTAGGINEQRIYSVRFPSGWQFCRVKVKYVSMAPTVGRLASSIAASASRDSLVISAWTPRRQTGDSRAWIEADFRLILVKSEALDGYVSEGTCKRPGRLHSCAGYACTQSEI